MDTPNPVFDCGEVAQSIRDRKILGLSAIAGYLEDYLAPDHPSFVRARWSRISRVRPISPVDIINWREVSSQPTADRLPKNKGTAVIVGTDWRNIQELLEEDDLDTAWPAAAYEYRGVKRAGLLPDDFARFESMNAVAMLAGRSAFKVSLGMVDIKGRYAGGIEDLRRREIRQSTLFIPRGIKILDLIPADELDRGPYDGIPLV